MTYPKVAIIILNWNGLEDSKELTKKRGLAKARPLLII